MSNYFGNQYYYTIISIFKMYNHVPKILVGPFWQITLPSNILIFYKNIGPKPIPCCWILLSYIMKNRSTLAVNFPKIGFHVYDKAFGSFYYKVKIS